MIKNKYNYFISLIVTLPAVIIGAIAMNIHDVPSIYYVLNVICLLTGWLISCYSIFKNAKKKKNSTYRAIVIFLILLLYALTFVDNGSEGVHRWLALGPIRLYVSSIFAPILIIELWKIIGKYHGLLVGCITALTAILLFLQPDASQLTAFAIPMMIILRTRIKNRNFSSLIIIILTILVFISWIFLDTLPAVIYVEDIVGMVMDLGLISSILGIISLVLLPIPFFLLPMTNEKILSRCIGLYFAIIIISTFFGNFPVPLMGYGVSPILGYLMAITWLINTKKE